MKTYLFSHIKNEQDLLPQWLNHHKNMFDHGIIIDYHSTDNSINIINEICPTWEIIKPLENFGSCVNSIQQLEEKYDGWKIALNVTEFLFISNLKEFIHNFEIKYPDMGGIRTRGCVLVDLEDNETYDKNIPLLKQKTNGYFEEETKSLVDYNIVSEQPIHSENEFIKKTAIHTNIGIDGRSRLLHKFKNGNYTQGRHATKHTNVIPRNIGFCEDSELILCWVGYSPVNIYKKRLNTGSRDRYRQFNTDNMLFYQRKNSYNLLNDDNYLKKYNELYSSPSSIF
jgi:hypothetical protein